MSAETIEIENTQAEEPMSGPGERLRAARIALGLDIKKVAGQLHLTSDVVEALERDDYAEMTARVFVRGYIGKYARLVELPVASVIEQFDQFWPDDARPVKVTEPPKLPSDRRLGKRPSNLVNWFLLLLVVILFLIWWQGYLDKFIGQQMGLVGQQPDTSAQEESATQEIQLAQTVQLPRLAQPQAAPQVVEPQPQEEAAIPAETEAVKVVELGITDENKVEEVAGGDATQTIGQTLANNAEKTDQTTESAEAVAAGQTPKNEIYISFSDVSWVDIYDEGRVYKLFGQMKKGDKHKLDGKPPYNLVIGNVNATSITVDGEAFDLKPYTKGNVARFTLTL